MSKLTDFLKLHVWQIPDDNEKEFDYTKSIAENYEKIDINAKQIDEKMSLLNTDVTNAKQDISDIQKEQISQNKEIQKVTDTANNIEGLLPTHKARGQAITLTDSARYRFKKFKISGNSIQEQTAQSANIFDKNDVLEAIFRSRYFFICIY